MSFFSEKKSDVENNHHVVPISLAGENLPCNIMRIRQDAHANLHKVLDIQPHIYSKAQRRIKEATNHKMIATPEEIEMWAELQRMFFDRINHLPLWLQKEHVKKGMERLDHYKDIYAKLTKDELDKPKRFNSPSDQFHELHETTVQ